MSLSIQEQNNLRSFLFGIYGGEVNSWPMNDDIFDLTYILLQKSRKCSDLMDLVPRPMPPGQSASKYITKQVRTLILNKIKDKKEHYNTCVTGVKWGMKRDFTIKANGL